MRTIQRSAPWIVALTCSLALAASTVFMSQQLQAQKETKHDARVLASRGEEAARDLSHAFRQAARDALPAIVSIETVGKSTKVSKGDQELWNQFGDNSPFGDFFKQDPRFKDMFKNAPREAPRTHGMGSGFIIDASGIVLTNNHVVADAEKVKVKLQDGTEYVGTDIKTDPRTDVAIVHIKADRKLPTIHLGDSDSVEVGDWVLAVGSPFGLNATVTAGIISAKGRQGLGITERDDFLQTDAAINPGNSGGPLINLNGEVVGINTAISSRSGGYDGIGFAIPVNMARWVSQQLVESGSVRRGYLGVGIQPINAALAKQLEVPVGKGALVSQVMAGSPAANAKLEAGDVIVKLNGKQVTNPHNLQAVVEQLRIGNEYPLEIVRNGKEMTLHVTIREMPQTFTASLTQEGEEKPRQAPRTDTESFDDLGMDVKELTNDVAQQLGYKGDLQGVLVSSVKDNSPASNSGLKTGMVIEKVANKPVKSPAEFKKVVEGQSVDKGILLLVRSPKGSHFMVLSKEQ